MGRCQSKVTEDCSYQYVQKLLDFDSRDVVSFSLDKKEFVMIRTGTDRLYCVTGYNPYTVLRATFIDGSYMCSALDKKGRPFFLLLTPQGIKYKYNSNTKFYPFENVTEDMKR